MEKKYLNDSGLMQFWGKIKSYTNSVSDALQGQIDDKQRQITANDEDISLLQTRSTQMEQSINNIAVTGGASVANTVAYSNTASGLVSINAQGAIDELAAKNATKAEKTEVTAELEKKFDKESILQESGNAEDKVMSQKAVSDKLSDLLPLTDVNFINVENEIGGFYRVVNDKPYLDKSSTTSVYAKISIAAGVYVVKAYVSGNRKIIITDKNDNILQILGGNDEYIEYNISVLDNSYIYASSKSNEYPIKVKSISGITEKMAQRLSLVNANYNFAGMIIKPLNSSSVTIAEKEDKSIDVIFNRTSYTIFGAKGNFETIKIPSSNNSFNIPNTKSLIYNNNTKNIEVVNYSDLNVYEDGTVILLHNEEGYIVSGLLYQYNILSNVIPSLVTKNDFESLLTEKLYDADGLSISKTPTPVTKGCYIDKNDGIVEGVTDYAISKIVNVVGLKKIIWNGYLLDKYKNVCLAVFYDSNMNIVSTISISDLNISSPISSAEITVPYNAIYARFCSKTEYKKFYVLISNTNLSINSLKDDDGKFNFCKVFDNIICIGDSVTDGAIYDYPRSAVNGTIVRKYSYPTQLAKMINCEIENAGFSGISASGWYDRKFTNYDFTKYDLAIIELGYNDGLKLSEIDTEGSNANSYKKIIEGIKSQNTNIQIILVISTQFNDERVEVIQKLSDLYSLPIIDLRNNKYDNLDNINYHGYDNIEMTSISYWHFNRIGYLAKAKVIYNELASYTASNLKHLNDLLGI